MHGAPESITEFLTDGSLAALCAALGELTRHTISLRDRSGSVIEHHNTDPPWIMHSDEHSQSVRAEIEALQNDPRARSAGAGAHLLIPIRTAGRAVGALRAAPLKPTDSTPPRLRNTLELVAQTVGELCDQEVNANLRGRELRVLYELSSLLVGSNDISAMLDAALRAAAMFFNADAGSVHLLDFESHNLTLRAWHGVSTEFTQRLRELPDHDTASLDDLGSRVILLEDSDRSISPTTDASLRAEGIVSFISLDLSYRARRHGVLRLYGRRVLEFTDSQTSLLRTIGEHVAAAVAAAELLQTERRHRETQRHLKLAADVQSRMRPRTRPEHPALDIEARLISSLELAGDFYDIFEFHGSIAVVVADVVGKGVPAALLMASLRASIRAHALSERDPSRLMSQTNTFLTRDTLDQEFATLLFLAIEPDALTLTYCNAGHEPPFIIRAGSDNAELLREGGLVLGVDESQDFPSAAVQLRPGDTLVACTDGLIEAQNFEGESFGRKRLLETVARFLRENPDAPARGVADHAIWEGRRFVGLHKRADDTTIVVIRAKAPESEK
ncbi:MAG: GAF domain-containing SpoIIE family protein phosphatase [Phycisphaerales bacterium]